MSQNQVAGSSEKGYSVTHSTHIRDGNAYFELIDNSKQQSRPFRYQEEPAFLDVQIDPSETAKVCRVCQCADADREGEAALKSLGISVPSEAVVQESKELNTIDSKICNSLFGSKIDLETGKAGDSLIELGCTCKSDIGLAHYACALRWFLSRGSVICEICGTPASNIRTTDRDKVVAILKERHSHHNGQSQIHDTSNQAVSWFDPHGNITSEVSRNSYDVVTTNTPEEGILDNASPAAKWAVEGTGILIATGLLTVTITWLISLRVDKGVATKGLNILLSGLCALVIVIFLRFGVLPRIKYGPARYWAILVVFWFLIFGVWASTTRSTHTNN